MSNFQSRVRCFRQKYAICVLVLGHEGEWDMKKIRSSIKMLLRII